MDRFENIDAHTRAMTEAEILQALEALCRKVDQVLELLKKMTGEKD